MNDIQSLLKEIQLTQALYPEQEMKTIYIGGGTPTSLSAKQLDVLLKGVREQLTFDDRNEFTVEANPGDLTQEKITSHEKLWRQSSFDGRSDI